MSVGAFENVWRCGSWCHHISVYYTHLAGESQECDRPGNPHGTRDGGKSLTMYRKDIVVWVFNRESRLQLSKPIT